MYSTADLEETLDAAIRRPVQSPHRLQSLADFVTRMMAAEGLPGVRGGTNGELTVQGLARRKDWDVAYEFAGKFRLLVSLKSMWRNAAGTVPNRLDDLMGEIANVQQLSPEVVSGYVVLFDTQADSKRAEDGRTWSAYFEDRLHAISIRRAPIWNQGLLEGVWFLRFDSQAAVGSRLVDPVPTLKAGQRFARALLNELRLREPAVPFEPATATDL
jgi:hypothetical protein